MHTTNETPYIELGFGKYTDLQDQPHAYVMNALDPATGVSLTLSRDLTTRKLSTVNDIATPHPLHIASPEHLEVMAAWLTRCANRWRELENDAHDGEEIA